MSCLFTLQMTTYYAVQRWSEFEGQGKCHNLYESFDDACDAIEEEIKAYKGDAWKTFLKMKPNREKKLKELEKTDIVKYWTLMDELCIAKMKVITKR